MDQLWAANGVALSPDEDFILVCELESSKILKVWLTRDKYGQLETFAEALPGMPDNLSSDDNGVWAALAITADPENPFQSMSQFPLLRKFVARCLSLVYLLFSTIDNIYPNDFSKSIAYKSGSFGLISCLLPSRATILRFDWKGNIVAAYHTFDGSLYTHVLDLDGHLYLGSLTQSYIAKVVRQNHL